MPTRAASTTTTRKRRTRKPTAKKASPVNPTSTKPLEVVITETVRPSTLLKFEDYKSDFKLRWEIHTYEINALIDDIKKLQPYAQQVVTYCKNSYNTHFNQTT